MPSRPCCCTRSTSCAEATIPGPDLHGRLKASAAPYVALLLIAPVLYDLGLTVAPDAVPVMGFSVAPLLLCLSFVAAFVVWLPFRASDEWGALTKAWFVLAMILWLYLVFVESRDDLPTDAAAIFVPLTVVLLWLKPPRRRDVWSGADAFAIAAVAASAIVLVLEVGGAVPSWYVTSGDYFVGLIEFDQSYHWLPFADLLGLDGRWGGFSGDPNEAGPLGAFLMVYGFARTGWRRLLFVAGGAMILLLADSRAAYAAASVGLLALVLLPGWSSRWRRITPARAVAAGFAVLTGLRMASDLATNPASTMSLTGRSTMWPEFLSLWPQSPMFGVGTAEILDAVRSGVLPPWASTGHNQYIDTLVRYGAVGLALSTGLLLLAVVIALGGVRRSSGVGLALLVVIIAASATNLLLDWRYPSAALSAVLIAVALSSRPQRLLAASSSVATSTTSTPSA